LSVLMVGLATAVMYVLIAHINPVESKYKTFAAYNDKIKDLVHKKTNLKF